MTDHRKSAQWEFYVIPAMSLPEAQKTISLPVVRRLAGNAGQPTSILIDGLAGRVNDVFAHIEIRNSE